MPSVLVVDDERIVTRDLEEILVQMGYDVVGTASSGEEAIEKARELHPDMILMDIMMPGNKDGITAGVEIGAELGIPVVFVTAYSDIEILERAKDATPYGYIVKPFQTQQLRSTIEMALNSALSQEQILESREQMRAAVEKLELEYTERRRAEEKLRKANDELEQQLINLKEELTQRKIVEIAKGVLMREMGLSEEESYKLIHKRSRDENTKMVEVARQLVDFFDLVKKQKDNA